MIKRERVGGAWSGRQWERDKDVPVVGEGSARTGKRHKMPTT